MPPLGTPAPPKPKCYRNASLSAIGRRRWSRLKNRPCGEDARAGADLLRSAFEPHAESYPTGRRLRDARRGLAQRSQVRAVGERVGGVVSLRLARKATGEGRRLVSTRPAAWAASRFCRTRSVAREGGSGSRRPPSARMRAKPPRRFRPWDETGATAEMARRAETAPRLRSTITPPRQALAVSVGTWASGPSLPPRSGRAGGDRTGRARIQSFQSFAAPFAGESHFSCPAPIPPRTPCIQSSSPSQCVSRGDPAGAQGTASNKATRQSAGLAACHFRARIEPFQSLAAPFAADLRRLGRPVGARADFCSRSRQGASRGAA